MCINLDLTLYFYFYFRYQFPNLSRPDDRSVRVFRPSHEELAGLQADVGRRLVVIEGAVSLGIVRLALIRQGGRRRFRYGRIPYATNRVSSRNRRAS